MRGGDVAPAAGPEGEEGADPGRRVDHPAVDDRRRDDAVGAVVARVEAVGAPQLAPRGEVVPGHDVAAGDHDLARPVVLEQGRRGVRVGRLAAGVGGPLDPPDRLAGVPVDAQDVRRVVGAHAVDDLDEERVVDQEGRRRVAPVQPEPAVRRLDVALPERVAVEVEGGQPARPRHHVDVLAVGHRRRRRHVLLAQPPVAVAQVAHPERPAPVPVEAPQADVLAVGDVQEDALAPDDGR